MTHENIYYLLPLVYTCEYVYIYHAYVYKKSLFLLLCCHTKRVSGIHSGFGYPRVWFWGRIITRIVFGAVLGFGFGFRVRVHRDSTRSESAPLPSLTARRNGTRTHVTWSWASPRLSVSERFYYGLGPRMLFLCHRGITPHLNMYWNSPKNGSLYVYKG